MGINDGAGQPIVRLGDETRNFTQRTRALYLHTLGPITPAPSKKKKEKKLYPPAPCAIAVHLKRLSNSKRPLSYVFFLLPCLLTYPEKPCLSCLSVLFVPDAPAESSCEPLPTRTIPRNGQKRPIINHPRRNPTRPLPFRHAAAATPLRQTDAISTAMMQDTHRRTEREGEEVAYLK